MLKVTNNKTPVIFSDIDGTFYDRTFKLNANTLADIDFAIKNGAMFNICTGNPCYSKMITLAKKINCTYLIGSEGSQIFDVANKEIIFETTIPFKTLQKVIEIAEKNKLYAFFWNSEKYFFSKEHPNNKVLYAYHFDTEDECKNIPKKYANEEFMPVKIELYSETAKPDLAIFKDLEGVEVSENEANVTILPKGVNKLFPIKHLINNGFIKNVELKEVMTIGDGSNDVAMLEASDFSYAMANGSAAAKKAAKYHTSAVEQNGLGEAILDYLYRLKNIVKKYLFHEFDK